jgi:hypothetical protein
LPSTLLGFTDVGTASSFQTQGGSFLIQVDGKYLHPVQAVVFQCILNQDVDGAPNCYAAFNPANPDGKNGGLDFLRNGTTDEKAKFDGAGNNKWAWNGLVSRDKKGAGFDIDDQHGLFVRDRNGMFPVFQPGKAFYVCRTAAIANSGFPDTDQRKYFDATSVSYGALSGTIPARAKVFFTPTREGRKRLAKCPCICSRHCFRAATSRKATL